jgi:hypothetical protein
MARSAIGLFVDPGGRVGERGNLPVENDRSLAAQRFRQVAPATDEEFVGRVALRRLSTQVVSDHFFGAIVASASAVNPKMFSMGIPSPAFRARVDNLITDLRQLIVENSTNESIDLSVAELRGSAEWDSKERYPSLAVFARDGRTEASSATAMSGRNIPALFEQLLARTERADRALPKIYRRVWDSTYWWADAVCSQTFGALLRLCLARHIQFHFRGDLSLIDLNAAVLSRLSQRWQILLCTEALREGIKHVAGTLRMPLVCLPVPSARLGIMKGFDADLVKLRDQNAFITDSLVCFPSEHPASVPLVKELVRRSDVIDVLTSLSRLIEPLSAEHRDETLTLPIELPQDIS